MPNSPRVRPKRALLDGEVDPIRYMGQGPQDRDYSHGRDGADPKQHRPHMA